MCECVCVLCRVVRLPCCLTRGSTAAVLILVPMMGMIIYFALAISRKEVITFKGW